MGHQDNLFDDPDLVRMLASSEPLRLEPRRGRWALGFALHVGVLVLCAFAWREGYFESALSQVSLALIALFLPVTAAHAVGWRCFVEVGARGIRQAIAGWTRTYSWDAIDEFALHQVQGRTMVVFQELRKGRARQRGIGFTYGMEPELLVRFLRAKKHLLRAAAGDVAAKDSRSVA